MGDERGGQCSGVSIGYGHRNPVWIDRHFGLRSNRLRGSPLAYAGTAYKTRLDLARVFVIIHRGADCDPELLRDRLDPIPTGLMRNLFA
jgi:hypothetical protein